MLTSLSSRMPVDQPQPGQAHRPHRIWWSSSRLSRTGIECQGSPGSVISSPLYSVSLMLFVKLSRLKVCALLPYICSSVLSNRVFPELLCQYLGGVCSHFPLSPDGRMWSTVDASSRVVDLWLIVSRHLVLIVIAQKDFWLVSPYVS